MPAEAEYGKNEETELQIEDIQSQWICFGGCHWSYCDHHGWVKCTNCEQDKYWAEQSELQCNEGNHGWETHGEPFLEKARCQEHTIMDDIFQLIGSLGD